MAEVDLDRLADAYGFRLDRRIDLRLAAMVEAAGIGPSNLVVDVGGGRGAKAAACAETGAVAVSVDPSAVMARHAADAGVLSVIGRGELLPLASDLADLVYFHLSIHHGDWRAMLDEAWRVARPGGVVWVWTMADSHHYESYLATWFPSVGPIDAARFPPVADIAAHFDALGATAETTLQSEHVRRLAGEWVRAVEAGYVSTLHLLPPGELESGLAAFHRTHPDPKEMIEYHLDFAAVWARKAS